VKRWDLSAELLRGFRNLILGFINDYGFGAL
jgi:hypothetical protein